jgi:hypothetical protein
MLYAVHISVMHAAWIISFTALDLITVMTFGKK